MIYLDSSFLVDYLRGRERVKSYLEDRREVPLFTPSVVTFELGYGALKHPSPDRTLRTVYDALDWVEVAPFTDAAAREAARIKAELRDDGAMISPTDVMIAGVVREAGGTLVTDDRDFSAVPDLDVDTY